MPRMVDIGEISRDLRKYVSEVAAGADDIIIADNGEPVARLAPAGPAREEAVRELEALLDELARRVPPVPEEEVARDVRRAIREVREAKRLR